MISKPFRNQWFRAHSKHLTSRACIRLDATASLEHYDSEFFEHVDSRVTAFSHLLFHSWPFSLRQRVLVGERCLEQRSTVQLTYPVNMGVVQRWEEMGHVWEHAFHDVLKVQDVQNRAQIPAGAWRMCIFLLNFHR